MIFSDHTIFIRGVKAYLQVNIALNSIRDVNVESIYICWVNSTINILNVRKNFNNTLRYVLTINHILNRTNCFLLMAENISHPCSISAGYLPYADSKSIHNKTEVPSLSFLHIAEVNAREKSTFICPKISSAFYLSLHF